MPDRSLDDVVAAICRMPLDQGPGDSQVSVLERTGYLHRRGEITADLLAPYLAANPSLIDAWEGWMDDDRSDPGWTFREVRPGVFEVVQYKRLRRSVTMRYEDRTRACAEYLVREIEAIAHVRDVWVRPWAVFGHRLAGAIRDRRH